MNTGMTRKEKKMKRAIPIKAVAALLILGGLAAQARDNADLKTEITADGLTVKAFSPRTYACILKKGTRALLNRTIKLGDGDYAYPEELEGLPRLLTDYFKHSKGTIRFSLNKPARLYALIKIQHQSDINNATMARWHLYQRDLASRGTIYYSDFPAGEHEIVLESSMFVCLGIRLLDKLSTRERLVPALRIIAGKPVLRIGCYDEKPEKIPCDIALVEAATNKQVYQKALTVEALPGKIVDVPLEMPAVPEGVFHFLTATVTRGDQSWQCSVPYGLFPPPPPDPSVQEPFFPYGGYDKTMYCVNDDPEIRGVCLSATFYHMRKMHMNTLVIGRPISFDLDLARKYGIKCVVRVSGRERESKDLIEHPSVLTVMVGDEPKLSQLDDYKARYDNFRAQFGTPILTCGVLDGYGTGGDADPLRVWPVLKPRIRFGRLYVFRKTHYDLLHPIEYKLWMSARSIFQSIENDPAPWWLAPQFFGQQKEIPYWRIPNGPELRGLMHLALAHRCEGLLGWCLHDHGKDPRSNKIIFSVFLDGKTMAPTEHSQLAILEEFGAKLMKAKHILKRFAQKRLGVYYRSTPEVEAAARWTRDGKICLYAVNMNTTESRDCEMQLAVGKGPDAGKNMEAIRSATEIFSGRPVALQKETSKNRAWSFVRLKLNDIAPGDGRLIVIDGDFPALPDEIKAPKKTPE